MPSISTARSPRSRRAPPSSRTSTTWPPAWPYKPDVVLEGGNMALSPAGKHADYADGLMLLSTYFQPLLRQFELTRDTSAASAQAARMAAIILARYPRYW